MAIGFRASSRAASATGTIPTGTTTGDVMIAFALRNGNLTAPSLPTGWTNINTRSSGSGGNSVSARWAWRAWQSGDGNPTFTNASEVIIHSYSGCDTAVPIGAEASNNGTDTTIEFLALTLQDTSGASWVTGAAYHRRPDVVIPTPTGFTKREGVGTQPGSFSGDTNAGVSSWAQTTSTVNRGEPWVSTSIELLVAQVVSNEINRRVTELPDAYYDEHLDQELQQGWQQSPLSADIPPEENQETINRRWTELPYEFYDKRYGHDFGGFQLAPTPDNFVVANAQVLITVPCYVPVNRDYTFVLQPLSDDFVEPDQETIARRHYDLPVWNVKYLGHSFDGWTQPPLADDNEESASRTVTENPEIRFARPLPDYTWLQSPTPDGVEDPLFGVSTKDTELSPWARDRNAYDGYQAGPLSADADEADQEAIFRQQTSVPLGVNRHSYDGWMAAPLADDAVEEIAGSAQELPPVARDRHLYDGWVAAPLPEVEEGIAGQALDLSPAARDRHAYDGFQAPPLPDNAVVDELISSSMEFAETMYWPPLDMGFMGQASGPTSDDFVAPEGSIWKPTIRVRRR